MKRQDKDIEYQSVILEQSNKNVKGRLMITGNKILFQKKVGLISKKYETEFQTIIESINKIEKEGYSKILITDKEKNITVKFILDTPVEANEISDKINNTINQLILDTEEKKKDEIDQRINLANYSTYVYDITLELWTAISLLFIIMRETINNNWDEVDDCYSNEYENYCGDTDGDGHCGPISAQNICTDFVADYCASGDNCGDDLEPDIYCESNTFNTYYYDNDGDDLGGELADDYLCSDEADFSWVLNSIDVDDLILCFSISLNKWRCK